MEFDLTDRRAWDAAFAKQSRRLERFARMIATLTEEINAGMARAGAALPPGEKVAALLAVKAALARYEEAVTSVPQFKPTGLEAVKARIVGLEQTFRAFGWLT